MLNQNFYLTHFLPSVVPVFVVDLYARLSVGGSLSTVSLLTSSEYLTHVTVVDVPILIYFSLSLISRLQMASLL